MRLQRWERIISYGMNHIGLVEAAGIHYRIMNGPVGVRDAGKHTKKFLESQCRVRGLIRLEHFRKKVWFVLLKKFPNTVREKDLKILFVFSRTERNLKCQQNGKQLPH